MAEPLDEAGMVALARKHARGAVAQLARLMKGEDVRISLAAATAILERAYGKPGARTETVPHIPIEIERIYVDPPARLTSPD